MPSPIRAWYQSQLRHQPNSTLHGRITLGLQRHLEFVPQRCHQRSQPSPSEHVRAVRLCSFIHADNDFCINESFIDNGGRTTLYIPHQPPINFLNTNQQHRYTHTQYYPAIPNQLGMVLLGIFNFLSCNFWNFCSAYFMGGPTCTHHFFATI